MALLRCDFFSEVLGVSTSMTVVLPQRTSSQIGMAGSAGTGPHPTLYLLHGLSDDDSTWTRRTSVERYVAPLGLAVVMPQVARSFYCDEAHGGRYWTFLSEELPAVASGFFPLSQRREETFVAGLSMGGYGAVKWALRDPQRFAAAASLSGALDVARLVREDEPDHVALWDRVFGAGSPEGSPDDLFRLLADAAADDVPPLYLCCGTADPLSGDTSRFAEAARGAGLPVTVDIGPGEHEWGYWDARIQDVLAWLPLGRP